MVAAAVAQSQAFVAGKVAARQPRAQRAIRVAAVQQSDAAPVTPLRFLAAGLAAAAVTVSAPAEAGVVLVQPEVKNFVKDQPAAKKPAAGKKAAAPSISKEESGSAGLGFETFRPLVLPVSLVAVVGAGAAAVKADPKFAELLDREWSAKDSNVTGAGYETAPGLKDTPFFGGSNTNGAVPTKKGTQKIQKAAQKLPVAKKAASTGKKFSLFGLVNERDTLSK